MGVHLPDEETKPIWGKMTAHERDWYERFIMADRYGNMKELRRLCDEAPSEKFEQLKEDIIYDLNRPQRETYSVRPVRKAKFNEWDYPWNVHAFRKEASTSEGTKIRNRIMAGQDSPPEETWEE